MDDISLFKEIDGRKWFTTEYSVLSQIKWIEPEIARQYASAVATKTSIKVRFNQALPLLGVKEHFEKSNVKISYSIECEVPKCECNNDSGVCSGGCPKVGYLLYMLVV